MLQQLLGRRESFPAVRIAGDPVANVRPAAGQRGRVRERRGCHRSEGGQRHRETVLLMIALRAPAWTLPGAHHHLRAVHAVLAPGAVRVLADGHQRLAAGGRFDASVAQVRVSACRCARRIAEESRRRGVMMRERRRASERRSERRILRQSRRATQGVASESWKTRFVRAQIRILRVAAGQYLHPRSDDGACAVVVTRRSVGLLAIRRRLSVRGGRAARGCRRLARGRGGLASDGRVIARRLLLPVATVVTGTDTTVLTTNTVHTSLRRWPTLVGRLLRDDVRLVRFERQRFPVRRAAARTPLQFRSRRRLRVSPGVHALGRLVQRGDQRLRRGISADLTACLCQ